MGCIKLEILDQQYKRTEIKVSSPQKELTSNFFVTSTRREIVVKYVDPTGMGWVEGENGVSWDQNTNSSEDFAKNYADRSGYSYVSDPDNPNSYTLPSGAGRLVMNWWADGTDIENGQGNVGISISFIPTNKSAEVGWTQTYCSNTPDVHSGNLWDVLPTSDICSERLDGGRWGGSSDASKAGYWDKVPNPTLADGPVRVKLPNAQYDVNFNAQSTVLVNGQRTVSIGWGFTITSETNQKVQTPTILKNTTEFHNTAVQSLSNRILGR